MLVGRETLLFFLGNEVSEYAIMPDSSFQRLYKIQADGKIIMPATYQETTNSAFFVTDNGAMQYLKMNENSIDAQYYKVKMPGVVSNNADWSISESWLYLSSGDVYYQYK